MGKTRLKNPRAGHDHHMVPTDPGRRLERIDALPQHLKRDRCHARCLLRMLLAAEQGDGRDAVAVSHRLRPQHITATLVSG